MGATVFANGMSIACKAASGKTIAAMPDVCLSPPSPPAGPIPIPYPNTAAASDTTDGSKTVQIGGQEVMLKNKSTFKTSTGNEAATKSLGMGVVTHQIQGKAAFVAWSMDVKFEGENVPRHLDLMGHNEQSEPPNSPPWLYNDSLAQGDKTNPCNKTAQKVETACTNKTYKNDTGKGCCDAKKCVLSPYGSQPECCGNPQKTKHHVVPDHCFRSPPKLGGAYYQGITGMSHAKGLCICVTGEDKNEKRKQHAKIHKDFDKVEDDNYPTFSFGSAKEEAAKSCAKHTQCNKKCLEHQIEKFYQKKGVTDKTMLRADSGGNREPPAPSKMGTLMKKVVSSRV